MLFIIYFFLRSGVFFAGGLVIVVIWVFLIKKMFRHGMDRKLRVFTLTMMILYILAGVVMVLDTGDFCLERPNERTCFYDSSSMEMYLTETGLLGKIGGILSYVAIAPYEGLRVVSWLPASNRRILFPWNEKPPIYESF